MVNVAEDMVHRRYYVLRAEALPSLALVNVEVP